MTIEILRGQKDLFPVIPFGLVKVPDLVLNLCQGVSFISLAWFI